MYSTPNSLLHSRFVQAVSLIAQGYPRGSKQLIGPFKTLFGPTDAAAWFNSKGVRLKTEGDGRMFPVTDDSQTIIDCLEGGSIMDKRATLYGGGTTIPYATCACILYSRVLVPCVRGAPASFQADLLRFKAPQHHSRNP